MTVDVLNFLRKLLAATFKLQQRRKEGNMHVLLKVGVFFPLLFFLKVAFACFDGMCYNFILQVFFFLFSHEKRIFWDGRVSIHFSVAASRVPILLVSLKN